MLREIIGLRTKLAGRRVGILLAVLTFFVGCSAAHAPLSASSPELPASPSNSGTSPAPTTLHGTVDSGGGRAVVCRNHDGTIKSVQSLDLYESDHTSHYPARASLPSLDAEWNAFATRMNLRWSDTGQRLAGYSQVATLKNQFMAHVKFVSEAEAQLVPIDDSKEAFTVPGCSNEQLANWQDDETILVQKELWNAMDPRDQAALIAHEFIYDAYRSLGARDSHIPRRIVGLAFSSQPLGPLPRTTRDFTCMNVTAPSSDNAFAVGNGSVDLALSGEAGLTLSFQSYPTQILLEPVSLPLKARALVSAIADCRKNDQTAASNEGQAKAVARTSYFKDELTIDLTVTCGAQRKSVTEGPELTLTLQSRKATSSQTYACHAAKY